MFFLDSSIIPFPVVVDWEVAMWATESKMMVVMSNMPVYKIGLSSSSNNHFGRAMAIAFTAVEPSGSPYLIQLSNWTGFVRV